METKLHPTSIDLSVPTRVAVIVLLNRQLADTIDLGLQAKQAHWNVKGPHFIGLHEMFDRLADNIGDFADSLAERAVELGGTALGTAQVISETSRLPFYPLEIAAGDRHIEALAKGLAILGASTRNAIESATQSGDVDTADLFTEISRDLDKLLWLVEAHRQTAG